MRNIIRKVLKRMHLIAPAQPFREYCWRNDAWITNEYQLPELTDEEVAMFKKTWPCFPSVDRRDLTYLRMYKHVYGFNPYFLPDFQFYEYIIKKTNPADIAKPFKNKAMYDVYLPLLPIAKTISKAVCGVKYDGENRQITAEEEVTLLCKHTQFIIKPSIDSGCGKGVHKVCMDKVKDMKKFVQELVSMYGLDYVAQEVIEQHPVLRNLNPTSLNTCRVTTLFFDGQMSYSTILKVGKLNADIDNWQNSYVIGVNQDGVVSDYGYDAKLKRVTEADNGIKFGGIRLPEFDKMISTVSYFHKLYFPMLGVLGWDVVVDKSNHVRIVEVNVDYPGIAGEQFASGPFFQSRRNDIIKVMQSI